MHTLLIGRTGSGKSNLARHIALKAAQRGQGSLLYDPIGNDFPCEFRTAHAAELLERAMATQGKVIFVDEAPTICNSLAVNKPNEWLATMSRHRHHRVFFLSQDATQLAPIYRRNCRHVYLFSAAPATCDLLAREFGAPRLQEAYKLHQYWFFYHTNFGQNGQPFVTMKCPPLESLESGRKVKA